MADVSVTINPPNSTSVTIGNVVTSHASSHAPGANDSIESYYYPRSNPSGYATSGDFATTGYVGEVSGYLYGQIAFPSNVVFTTGSQTIGGTKNFSTRPTVNGTGVLLSGEASIGSTGYLSGYVQKTETGNFLTSSQTGEFYPRSNPSGYITGVNLSAYQTIAASTGISGYLQGQISAINVASGQFLTTGAADNRYVNVSGDTIYGSLTVTGTTSGHSFALDPTGCIDFQYGVPSHKEGRVFYDINSHSLCYFNDEPDVMLNIGQEQVVRVSNGWTGNILNGWVVYASGAVGNRPAVYPASAVNSTELYRDIIGVATHDISNQGYITTLGLVNSLNTTGFSEGQTVYLSTQSGLLTSTKPIPPNHAVKVGIITRSHQTQGQLFVNIDQGNHLGSLHDVNSTGVQNHDLIRYNSASGYWENFQANFVTGNVVRPNETGVFLTGETDPIFLASTAYLINSTLTGQWGESYNDSITGVSVVGTSSKTITLYQRDGSTLTANFSDIEGTGGGGTDYFLTGASFNSGNGNLSLYVNDGSIVTASIDGRYTTGSVVRPSETGNFLVSSDLSSYQTISASTGISGYLQSQISSINLEPTGAFLTTGAADSRYYSLSNPSGYLTSASIVNLATTGYVTGVSGYLQSQISSINSGTGIFVTSSQTGGFYPSSNPSGFITGVNLTAYQTVDASTGISGYLQNQIDSTKTATGVLNVRVSSLESVSGSFALSANTGAFLTTGAADSRYYSALTNPSGYLVAADISNLASIGYVTGASGYLQSQISSINSSTGSFVTGQVVRPSETGNFVTSSQTGLFLTGVDLSSYATTVFVTGISGYQSGLISSLYSATGLYALKSSTGSFLTTGAGDARYYPLATNPSGYLVVADIANLATTGYVTSASGYLQGQISLLNSLSGQTSTGYNRSITGITVGGTDTKTITLYQQNGVTLTADFADLQSTGGGGSVSNVVYLTGDQNISGIKNFYLRPTVNGTPVLLSGEASAGGGAGGPTNFFVGAGEMIPRSTSGCGVDSIELTGNFINCDTLDFDPGTNEYAQFIRVMPNNWNSGNISAQIYWTAFSGSGNVVWSLNGRSYADNTNINAQTGAYKTGIDTFLSSGFMHISPTITDIEPTGTIAVGNPLIFQVGREASNGSDTFGTDAKLLGISIYYN